MRLANIATEEGTVLALATGRDLVRAEGSIYETTDGLIHAGGASISALREGAPASGQLLPAVLHPEKVICVGLNYERHIGESRMDRPPAPCLFAKFASSLAAHGAVIRPPDGVAQLDYEGELAVIIGREGRNVSEKDALEHIFGYTIANDLSSRDLQFLTSQWLSGKMPDGFCPLGPWIVTRDEVPEPQALTVRTWVNDALVQDGRTENMIFPVRTLIAHISQLVTLRPGDVILTGTPDGVQFGKDDPQWLRPGDRVEVEIRGLGRLSNEIGRAASMG